MWTYVPTHCGFFGCAEGFCADDTVYSGGSSGGGSSGSPLPPKKIAVVPVGVTPPKVCDCPPPADSFALKTELASLVEVLDYIDSRMSALVYSKNLESRFDSAIDTFLSKAPQNISDMQAVTSYNTTGLIDELYSLTPLISKDSGFFSPDIITIPDCSTLKTVDFFSGELVDSFCFKFGIGDKVFFDSVSVWTVDICFFSQLSESQYIPVYRLSRSANGRVYHAVVPQSLLTLYLEKI